MNNNDFDPRSTACFTGHRMIRQSLLPQVRERLAEELAFAYSNGYRTFLCGGARGFDTLAAQEILRFRETQQDVRLVLVIPCADQASRWTASEKKIWQSIKECADDVCVLSETYYAGCMQARNRFMVDRSTMCLCWMTRFEGGTWSTVRYALYSGVPVRNLAMPDRPSPVMKENSWNYISISRSVSGNANTARLSLFLHQKRKRANTSQALSGKRK